jgi:formylmethanofuran dehydrogenase subunit E
MSFIKHGYSEPLHVIRNIHGKDLRCKICNELLSMIEIGNGEVKLVCQNCINEDDDEQ